MYRDRDHDRDRDRDRDRDADLLRDMSRAKISFSTKLA